MKYVQEPDVYSNSIRQRPWTEKPFVVLLYQSDNRRY